MNDGLEAPASGAPGRLTQQRLPTAGPPARCSVACPHCRRDALDRSLIRRATQRPCCSATSNRIFLSGAANGQGVVRETAGHRGVGADAAIVPDPDAAMIFAPAPM